jgi:RNA polymerase sigma factor (sigma-70 family)
MATLPTPPDDGLPPGQFFLGHLKLIEEIISYCCRGSHFSREEAEDFGGMVKVKLIENDYAVIREFRQRSSPKTYLTTVISNLHKDYRNHLWRKWRASAEGVRLGPVALRLEELLYKEWRSFDEACQILWTNEGVELSLAQLEDIRRRIPHRSPRKMVGEEHLQLAPTRESQPYERLREKERQGERRRIYMALQRALDTLDKEDKLLVKMRTEYSVADIARLWKVEQKPLYRQLTKIYDKLRKELARQGVRRQDVDDILGSLETDYSDSQERG